MIRKLAAIVAIVAAVTITGASPTWAHAASIVGTEACSGGRHEISWTIRNEQLRNPMAIEAATAGRYEISGYASPVAGADNPTHATTSTPGTATGAVTATLEVTWVNDGRHKTISGTVELSDPCTVTTTTPTTTTPTTTVPATTSPTTAPCDPSVPPCAMTGTETAPFVLVGVGAVLFGAGILYVTRRSRAA